MKNRFLHTYQPRLDSAPVEWRMDAAAENLLRHASPGGRVDANETLAFSRSLEHIFAEAYKYITPASKGRSLLPVNSAIPDGATSHTYREIQEFGEADLVDSLANDFPQVTAVGRENTTKIFSFGDAYAYDIMDVRRAAMLGVNIDAEKATMARDAMERKLDKLLCLGEPRVGLNGLSTALSVSQAVTTGGVWTDASGNLVRTPTQILADVNAMALKIFKDTKGEFDGTGVVLKMGTINYGAISAGSVNPDFRDLSVKDFLLKSCPWLRDIQHWGRLDTAGAGGKERMIMHVPDRRVVEAFLPTDFEQFPPQARNLSLLVNCHMRFGGVVIRFPKATAYMDSTNP